jgi:hypothetical protein
MRARESSSVQKIPRTWADNWVINTDNACYIIDILNILILYLKGFARSLNKKKLQRVSGVCLRN